MPAHAHQGFCKNLHIVIVYRSYGVLLWEIATYGCLPLEERDPCEIVEMAQNGIITHDWYV